MEPLKLKNVCFRPAVDDKGFDIFCGEKEPIGYLCHIYPDGQLELLKWLAQKQGVTQIGGNDMPKVDEPSRFRVSKWSIRSCYAEDIEKWMNEVNPDYVLEQHFQQGDDLVLVLRHWPRRRVRRRPVATKVPKKKAVKKETAKK